MAVRAVHLAALLAGAALAGVPPSGPGQEPAPVAFEAPLGLPEIPFPRENPRSPGRAELGRRLFFDPLLSADRTRSCSSCHRPERGFADDVPVSLGVGGRPGRRNAPSLLNRAYGERFTWDGRFDSLEQQVLEPIGNPRELALGVDRAVERLSADPSYAAAFEAAFGRGPNQADLARALAGFVRGLTLGDSPVDRFRELGQRSALTPEQRAGLWIYESKGGCWRCHSGPNFTDEGFHNTGVGLVDGAPRPGRHAVTGDEADRGRFKTPTLRGVARTAPYMHDGSIATLAEVVEFYRRGGGSNPGLDPELRPLELTDGDAAALVAFLEALSGRPE